jgi:hypothetical protein
VCLAVKLQLWSKASVLILSGTSYVRRRCSSRSVRNCRISPDIGRWPRSDIWCRSLEAVWTRWRQWELITSRWISLELQPDGTRGGTVTCWILHSSCYRPHALIWVSILPLAVFSAPITRTHTSALSGHALVWHPVACTISDWEVCKFWGFQCGAYISSQRTSVASCSLCCS